MSPFTLMRRLSDDMERIVEDTWGVEVSEGSLVIQGERKEEKEQKEKGYYAAERSYGAFLSRPSASRGREDRRGEATFKDGVLEIAMPAGKQLEKHGRQLEIT